MNHGTLLRIIRRRTHTTCTSTSTSTICEGRQYGGVPDGSSSKSSSRLLLSLFAYIIYIYI